MRGRIQEAEAGGAVKNGSFNCVQRNALTNRNTSWDNNAVGLLENSAHAHMHTRRNTAQIGMQVAKVRRKINKTKITHLTE